ncbi:uncharacterized protein LOC126372049 [Pectinophora gossypiella]|uniref:uncharacterized protein LOC126372049 n=1 Tax=Pectinophora gossypiella TaxID=13191 RepID=UPI00214EFA3B|nr:uncharacterized protein LOC126372049 [Pectinophora gossypiella]
MHLCNSIFIVHRGKVVVSKGDEKLFTLKKGSIFGQLSGHVIRPIRITAQSVEHTDLLHITIKQFQDIISDEVRQNISDNPQSRFDFMAVKKPGADNPYNSIEYILRERKTIKLPMEVQVLNNRCVKKYIRFKRLFSWWYGLDIASLLLPLLTFVTDDTSFLLARLLRIHSVCLYQRHFCRNFQTRYAPVLVKFVMVVLLLHAFTCGWIIIACGSRKNNEFPVTIPELPHNISMTVNPDEWTDPRFRNNGCPRCTKTFNSGTNDIISFLVPTEWYADYLVALAYIVITHTHTNMDTEITSYLKGIYIHVCTLYMKVKLKNGILIHRGGPCLLTLL